MSALRTVCQGTCMVLLCLEGFVSRLFGSSLWTVTFYYYCLFGGSRSDQKWSKALFDLFFNFQCFLVFMPLQYRLKMDD